MSMLSAHTALRFVSSGRLWPALVLLFKLQTVLPNFYMPIAMASQRKPRLEVGHPPAAAFSGLSGFIAFWEL